MTDLNAIDNQLPSLNNCIDFLIDSFPYQNNKKQKYDTQIYLQTMVMTITKITYLIYNFNHQFKLNICQLTQILKQSSTELDLEYDNKQERMQSNSKHHVKEAFPSSMLICFRGKIEDTAKFVTQYVKKLELLKSGFDNYHKIVTRDHVCGLKFWHM